MKRASSVGASGVSSTRSDTRPSVRTNPSITWLRPIGSGTPWARNTETSSRSLSVFSKAIERARRTTMCAWWSPCSSRTAVSASSTHPSPSNSVTMSRAAFLYVVEGSGSVVSLRTWSRTRPAASASVDNVGSESTMASARAPSSTALAINSARTDSAAGTSNRSSPISAMVISTAFSTWSVAITWRRVRAAMRWEQCRLSVSDRSSESVKRRFTSTEWSSRGMPRTASSASPRSSLNRNSLRRRDAIFLACAAVMTGEREERMRERKLRGRMSAATAMSTMSATRTAA
mmetsp:Transcript_2391/g.4965  ORF Transcript_2391/g.4965 Transcript_2391/m.4965 type:complete len:289 (-) Transcript_2391:283-1149(-)